jgi:hypothetical protein
VKADGKRLVSCSAYFIDPEDKGDVPPKRRLTLNGLHSVISQKIALFLHPSFPTPYDHVS